MPTRRSALAVGAAILLVVGSACGARPEGTPGPASLLLRARSVFESTHAVHFSLASTGASGSGAQLVGGEGDLVRPEDVRGSFTVAEDGLHASVKVLAVGRHFYAELPFTSRYTTVDPSRYGISDPAALLSPKGGLSSLLSAASRRTRSESSERIGGELVDVVSSTVPGTAVPVLPDAHPSKPVHVTAAVDPKTYQLRRLTIAGPLVRSDATTTYTVTFTRYGERVSVSPPTG